MTIANSNFRDDYIGNNAVSVYDYNFKIFNKAHILVVVREITTSLETTLVLDTDYSVQDVGESDGGTITLIDTNQVWLHSSGNLSSAYAISLLINPTFEQQTDLRNQGAYSPANVEDQFDKLYQLDLKQERSIALSLKLPVTLSAVSAQLPAPVANAAIGWNAAKTAIVNLLSVGTLAVSAFGEILLNLATAAAVRSTLRSDVWCGTATGTANALTLTPASAIAGYSAGDSFTFKSGAAANTGATTINISAVGAVAAQSNGNAMVGGEIEVSKWYRATYDGAVFQVERIAPALLLRDFLSYLSAKGDLIYASAASVPARLPNGVEMWMPTAGRLTLTTLVPVTSADVLAATTVYFTPYKGNVLQLYDGDTWIPTVFGEMSQATTDATKSPAAVAVDSNYDVFVWNDAGTLRATRGPAWTSATARGTGAGTTELELLEGRYVNKVAITNGPTAQRGLYVGTIRSTSASQIEDSKAKRYVWNNYNRVPRGMRAVEATNSWTYSTNSFRQANASTTNQLDFVRGLDEDVVSAHASNVAVSSTATFQAIYSGVGLDSTTAFTGLAEQSYANNAGSQAVSGHYSGLPGIGRHFLAWLEAGAGADTQTWNGDGGGLLLQTGIQGEMLA